MSNYIIAMGIILGALPDNLFGQNLPSIQLDRPDQTECPFITPKKFIQIENGFTIEKVNAKEKAFTYPSTLWKYGINEKLELRIITEYLSQKIQNELKTGLHPITIGFKTALWEEKKFIPKTSFIGHLTTSSIGSEHFKTRYIAPAFRFTMQHTLSNKVTLAYNLGAEWNGENAEQDYIYTLTSGFSVTEKLGCYAELYGFISDKHAADTRMDGGVTYLFSSNFIADISGGFGLSKISPEYYVSLGISYRFKLLR